MDTVTIDRQRIETVLTRYLELHYANGEIQNELIIDRTGNQFVLLSSGWQGPRRIHGCLVHITIQDGLIWIQRDGTEHGIANDLVAVGIPRERIVLGFYSRQTRQHTDFASA
jgi:XisI protein